MSIKEEKKGDLTKIKEEVIWGSVYRNQNRTAVPKEPKKSPKTFKEEECPFEKKSKKKKSKQSKAGLSKQQEKLTKMNLLDRSMLSQKQYCTLLAIPNYPTPRRTNMVEEIQPRKLCMRYTPCSPRIVQLSVPNKRLVFENWKAYADTAPPERIVHFEALLHNQDSLEPEDAHHYFKTLDKKNRKLRKIRAKKRMRKKNAKQRKEKEWLIGQIDEITNLFSEYIKEQPVLALNYKQGLLADDILKALVHYKYLTRKKNYQNRHSKNGEIQGVQEIVDKVAVWIDSFMRIVDTQVVQDEIYDLTRKDASGNVSTIEISSIGSSTSILTDYTTQENESEEGESEEDDTLYQTATDDGKDASKGGKNSSKGGKGTSKGGKTTTKNEKDTKKASTTQDDSDVDPYKSVNTDDSVKPKE